MKRIFLILSFLQLCLCKTEAQFFNASAKDIEKLKNRTLIVVLQESDPAFEKRISKHPEKLKRYNTIISETNETLKKYALKYWTINDIDFKSYSQIKDGHKEDTSFFTLNFSSLQDDIEMLVQKDYTREELLAVVNPGAIEIKLMEHFKGAPVYVWNTPTAYPFEGDLIIAIQQIRNFFSFKYEDLKFNLKSYAQLTSTLSFNIAYKTLLLDSAQVKKYENSFNYIQQEYSHPYKLTNFAEIINTIKSRDTNYAYIAIIPYHDEIGRGGTYEGAMGGGMSNFSQEYFYIHLVIDASSSTIISMGSASMFWNLNNFDRVIDKYSLKTIR